MLLGISYLFYHGLSSGPEFFLLYLFLVINMRLTGTEGGTDIKNYGER